MQALWSRAAQTNSCKCRSCLNAATVVARRTTTAASIRRLKVGDLFTACYSTILGTAVFVDARAKEERRKEWDRAIAEAKAGTFAGQEDGISNREARIRKGEIEHLPSRPNVIPVKELFDPLRNGATWSTLGRSSATLESQLKTLKLHLKQSHNVCKDEISSPLNIDQWNPSDEWELDPLLPREPLSKVHMQKMQEMIAKLVTQILIHTKSFSLKRGDIDSMAMMERVQVLRNGHTQFPSFSTRGFEETMKERRELNTVLYKIFQQASVENCVTDLMIAKICYNLLISSAPPSVKTYNILIYHFTKLGRPEIAQVVVSSLFCDSRYRPNQKTIRYILEFYIARKDKVGFRAMVQRMRGVRGNMKLKTRRLGQLDRPVEQVWAMTNKVIHRNGYLVQKVPRNTLIFDALISGSLELFGIKPALRYVRAALREGFKIRTYTLKKILRSCLATMDAEAAKTLLHALLSRWHGNLAFSSVIEYDAETRHSVYQLLHLCNIQSPLSQTTSIPFRLPKEPLERMLNYTSIESISAAIDRITATISQLQDILGFTLAHLETLPIEPNDVASDISNILKFNRALTVLATASAVESRRLRDKTRTANREQSMPLKLIELELRTVAKHIISMNKILLQSQYNKLPEHLKKSVDKDIAGSEHYVSEKLDVTLSLLKRHQKRQKRKRLALKRRMLVIELGRRRKSIQKIEMEINTIAAPQRASNTGRKSAPKGETLQGQCLSPKPAINETGHEQIGHLLVRHANTDSSIKKSICSQASPASRLASKGRGMWDVSVQSSWSGNSLAGTTGKSKSSIRSTDAEEIASWLQSLKLHKYTDKLKNLKWAEFVELDEKALEERGIHALGARRKLLRSFGLATRKPGADEDRAAVSAVSTQYRKQPSLVHNKTVLFSPPGPETQAEHLSAAG